MELAVGKPPIRKKRRQSFSVRLDTDPALMLRSLASADNVSISDSAEELIFFAFRSRAYAIKGKAVADHPAPKMPPRPRSAVPRASITVRLQGVDKAMLQAVAERFGMPLVAFVEELITFSLSSRTYKAKLAALPPD